jgi:LysR family transcriptional regulator, regulator for genes of the gallate degradation pathway
VRILDGPYDELLGGLRRGSIDFLIGALRDPAPIGDIIQKPLFDDRLALIAGPAHPLAGRKDVSIDDLLAFPWVVPRSGTPTRHQFETLFLSKGRSPPPRVIESGSLLLMRELMEDRQHLGIAITVCWSISIFRQITSCGRSASRSVTTGGPPTPRI